MSDEKAPLRDGLSPPYQYAQPQAPPSYAAPPAPGAMQAQQPQMYGGMPPPAAAQPMGYGGMPPPAAAQPMGYGGMPPPAAAQPMGYSAMPPQSMGYPGPQAAYPAGYAPGGYPAHATQYQQGGPIAVAPPQLMVVPAAPMGLELLSAMPFLVVKQQIELLELITNIETENRYNLHDPAGNWILTAQEISECCARQCLGHCRDLEMNIFFKDYEMHDPRGLFIKLRRDCRCYFHEMNVFDGADRPLGMAKRRFTCCGKHVTVYDEAGAPVYQLVAPCCACCEVRFSIMRDEVEVGHVTKKWSGLLKEAFTDADNFVIMFPEQATAKERALLIGACMLIDYTWFERPPRRRR